MKKYNEFILEDMKGALVEPQSPASEQAGKLGLQYVGFGRYEDPRTQQITHIVQDGRLVPFNKAVKTNTFKKVSGDDFGDYAKNLKPEIEQHHQDLSNFYLPENYDENELAALEAYTGGGYVDINSKLASLPAGVPADQIETEYEGDTLQSTIAALDSALSKVPAPKDFLTYVSLGNAFRPEELQAGQVYSFKSYRSTTIDPNIALNFGSKSDAASRRKQTALVQIKVKKGSKGMYVDDYSTTPGEAEFLLPRGSSFKIVGGPNKLVGSNGQSGELNHQVMLFDAELVKNK